MRGTQLARQWKIIKLIESRKKGITGTELSNELEVPLRTVYRDLEAIQEAGFPIYTDREGKNSYWKLLDTFKKDFPVPLTMTELMALHMSRDLLTVFQGTIFHDSIESLFNKVKTALSPETLRYVENISGRLKISIGPAKNFSDSNEVIKTLSEATAKRRTSRNPIPSNFYSSGHQEKGGSVSGMGHERWILPDRTLPPEELCPNVCDGSDQEFEGRGRVLSLSQSFRPGRLSADRLSRDARKTGENQGAL